MRRKEHEIADGAEIENFLVQSSYGTLAIPGPDYPVVIPLNFVWFENAVYFHTSKAGEKAELFKQLPKVTFSVSREFTIVPSIFSDSKLACPATAFFKSVLIYGIAVLIEDAQAKSDVLAAFMRKLQPEGGYLPFAPDHEDYKNKIRTVGIIRLQPVKISAKFKFGQNLTKARCDQIRTALLRRGQAGDPEAVREMEKYSPFNKKKI